MGFQKNIDGKFFEEALRFLIENPELLTKVFDLELSLPNIPLPTMGGKVFWITLAEYKGYKLQQNHLTHHARILDANNRRIAWGTFNGMMKFLDKLNHINSKYSSVD